MSLKDTIANAVDTAFTAIGEVAIDIEYRHISTSYNAENGQTTETYTTTNTKAVVSPFGFGFTEFVESEHSGDLAVLCQYNEFEIPPKTEDKIIISIDVYSVNLIQYDEAKATYRFIADKK